MIVNRIAPMKDKDGVWTDYAKKLVFGKAPLVDVHNPKHGRWDSCKACIKEDYYGNRDSEYGWEIEHVYPESLLRHAGVPQDLIDDIDNLRPMHWRNNVQKDNKFPIYGGVVTAVGDTNLDVSRDYRVNRDQINVLRSLYGEYLDIPQPTILGQWQVMPDRKIVPTTKIPAQFFDEIHTPSIYDLQ